MRKFRPTPIWWQRSISAEQAILRRSRSTVRVRRLKHPLPLTSGPRTTITERENAAQNEQSQQDNQQSGQQGQPGSGSDSSNGYGYGYGNMNPFEFFQQIPGFGN